MTARVTWLLPVKEGMPYLPETLASIERQTFRDWEVLAWDNGSTDGSIEVLRESIPALLSGRVVTGRPLPLGACLAAMVEESRSELLARIDADDVNEPQRLAEQVALLEACPDVIAVGSWMQGVDGNGTPTVGYDFAPADARAVRWLLFFANHLCHPTMCLRRAAVLQAGNYRDMTPGQDYDLWLRMIQRGPIADIPKRLVRYRQRADSVGGQHRSEWGVQARALAQQYAPALFPGVPVERAMRVWDFGSHFSATAGEHPPDAEDVLALARAATMHSPWLGESLLDLPQVRRLAARCKPWTAAALCWRTKAWWHRAT